MASWIERPPTEIVCMILSALPDVASLLAAVLSCPRFYAALLGDEASVTSRVVLNQIDVSVLPEATAAWESSQLRPRNNDGQNKKAIMDFVARNIRQRQTTPKSWSLKEALRLGRLYSCVEQWAKKFAEKTLASNAASRALPGATDMEIFRIQRALYRFEIYCYLFRETPELPFISSSLRNSLFFAHFAPWENEQLGCIYHFLIGAFSQDFSTLLSRGYTPDIIDTEPWTIAETDADRELFLSSGFSLHPPEVYLHQGFINREEFPDNLFLFYLTPEQEFFADPDSGPADVWRRRCNMLGPRNWVYSLHNHSLRGWGFVMWDKSRLKAMNIL
ncbi:hypothetical protein GGS24DRAFT_498331 [Hypoxylon argillaceum]|nr:hypothetical protein GGS24DRAFT_498331 [Hypoxylon argillaceum]